jgi:nucleoside-diphosphate-sugar epimerase
MEKILVTGACGQIGTELVPTLRTKYGADAVLATGHVTKPTKQLRDSGPFQYLNVLDKEQLTRIIVNNQIDTIYHMAAILSVTGESHPQRCYEVNMNGLYNILEVARKLKLKRVLVSSSIAVFGRAYPRQNTPNETTMLPNTMYGITKVCGELLGDYYHHKFGVDFRAIRLPGIISSETKPGGGTTDYAVEIYYAAVQRKHYTCFVREDTVLPMMYMPDALNALIDLAEADDSTLNHRVYNVNAMSFSAGEQADSIKKIIPDFSCDYKPDDRQTIADSWPKSLDDSAAREEWGWKPQYDLSKMTEDMINKLRLKMYGARQLNRKESIHI